MANFKAASLKLQFLFGMDGEKELKKMRVYNNISEEATEQQLVKVKDLIGSLSKKSIILSEFVTTKSL